MNKRIIFSVNGNYRQAAEITTPIWPTGQVQLKFSSTPDADNTVQVWRTSLDMMLTEMELLALENLIREARLSLEKPE